MYCGRVCCATLLLPTCSWRSLLQCRPPGLLDGRLVHLIRSLKNTSRQRQITVYEGMRLSDLANNLKMTPRALCQHPEIQAEKLTSNSRLSMELAELIVLGCGHTAHFPRVRDPLRVAARDPQKLQRCPPVITVMGHVDHGKTSLLDALRKTAVAEGEAGGITQHIGAFSVTMANGDRITFLDTPGHAAFSAMRARGASITDIVVLVVAADDGVKPQTQECINLTQQAKVPIVVAINKCDKHTADVKRVKNQLLQHGIQLEEFGGDVQSVEISALKDTGLVELEEAILAQAELSSLKADYTGRVEGVVLEVKSDRGLGSVATVLVQHGQLKRGQVLVAGEVWAKVRTLFNDSGKRVEEAGPSTPVLTAGWRELPAAGELCLQVKSEDGARHVIEQRVFLRKKKEAMSKREFTISSEDTMDKKLVVPVVVKGDVAGSVEALLSILTAKQPEELDLEVIHSGVGPISDSDVETAISVGGVVLGFNVTAVKSAAMLGRQRRITILTHNVIYKLLDDLRVHLEGRLPEEEEEEIIGEAAVIQTFKLTRSRAALVGGCRVKKGELVKDAIYRLIRNEEVVHEGRLSGMMRNKDNITTAKKETECGISFSASGIQFQEGDWVQCVRKNKVSPTLHWHLGF